MVSYRAQCHEQNGTIAAFHENQDIQNERCDRLPSKHLGGLLWKTAIDCVCAMQDPQYAEAHLVPKCHYQQAAITALRGELYVLPIICGRVCT